MSCPHYLGEIVIYLGLLVVLHGRQLNAWLILLWVVRLLSGSFGGVEILRHSLSTPPLSAAASAAVRLFFSQPDIQRL